MQAAWAEVMDVLQAELSGPTFNNYLRHIKPVALHADALTLSVPSDFVKDWLVRRFARRIEETLEQFLGRPMVLAFQTSGATESYDSANTPEPCDEPEQRAAALQEDEEQAPALVSGSTRFQLSTSQSQSVADRRRHATLPAAKRPAT
jgi:chromosomal replication initiation ATPase DnaA